MGNVFDTCREMICSALHSGLRSEMQSSRPGAAERMLNQQSNLYVNLLISYCVCVCVDMQMHKGMCSCIGRYDLTACIGLACCPDARPAAQRKIISRLRKYCVSAIDGRKCTNSVFWGGVRREGVNISLFSKQGACDMALGVIDEQGGGVGGWEIWWAGEGAVVGAEGDRYREKETRSNMENKKYLTSDTTQPPHPTLG